MEETRLRDHSFSKSPSSLHILLGASWTFWRASHHINEYEWARFGLGRAALGSRDMSATNHIQNFKVGTLVCPVCYSPHFPFPQFLLSHMDATLLAPSQLCSALLCQLSTFSSSLWTAALTLSFAPQIYAAGISQGLVFSSFSRHTCPVSLSLALILYFWDSICTEPTDGEWCLRCVWHTQTVYTVHRKRTLGSNGRKTSNFVLWMNVVCYN